VETIEEGIEILTGVQAGAKDEQGKFPEGSVYQRTNEHLRQMAETLASFSRPADPDQAPEAT
jgi:hypothetical protein